MEVMQNDNYLSSDVVNQEYDQNFMQGSIKRYDDLSENIPTNTNIRKPMNTLNSYNNINISQNQIQKKKRKYYFFRKADCTPKNNV